MKPIIVFVVLLAGVTSANARNVIDWDCGESVKGVKREAVISVEKHKNWLWGEVFCKTLGPGDIKSTDPDETTELPLPPL